MACTFMWSSTFNHATKAKKKKTTLKIFTNLMTDIYCEVKYKLMINTFAWPQMIQCTVTVKLFCIHPLKVRQNMLKFPTIHLQQRCLACTCTYQPGSVPINAGYFFVSFSQLTMKSTALVQFLTQNDSQGFAVYLSAP